MTGIRLLLLAWIWSFSASVLAQANPVVTAPIVQVSTAVPYPEGAQGDASVLLELLVDKDGGVAEISVVEGTEPFAEHARRAVLAWRFAPASRGDVPVAARIRARIEFRQGSDAPQPTTDSPPLTVVDSTTTAPNPKTDPPKAAPQAEAVEVLVHGQRHEIGQTTLSAADVEQMPGAFGDPFRAVEALPGVTPVMSALPYFYVRGAPPNNSGYLLDGIRVPLLFHLGLGPSVIHPGLVERLDFYPGVAPVRYGGFSGAIVAAETKEPAAEAHGEANVRLVDAGALLETPFADGRGNLLVAGRYGYPGPILSAISDIRLAYWDYQARASLRVGSQGRMSVFAFGSHDYLGHTDPIAGEEEEDLVSDFHRVDLRYDHEWRDGRIRLASTLGYDSQGATPTYLTNRSAAVRLEFEQQISPALRVRGGADARIDVYGFEATEPTELEPGILISSVYPPPTNFTPGAHADLVWRIAPRVEVVPGVRVTLFDSRRAGETGGAPSSHSTVPAADPRLSARVTLASRVAWLSSVGLAHQYPTLRVGELPAVMVAGAGFPAGRAELQKTLQTSQGVEVLLPAEVQLTVTGFLSRSWGLTDLTANCLQIEPPSAPAGEGPRPEDPYFCPSDAPVRGRAWGLELLLRRSLSERLTGFLSYTLSRSVREGHFLKLDGSEVVATVPSDFDRTHLLNAIFAYDLGRKWRAGTRFVFYTGVPYSPLSGNVPVPPYNSLRDPAFFRVDVRLEKRWLLGQGRSIAWVLEGQNVTLSKEANTLGMDCRGNMTPDTYTTVCKRGTVGPLTIPSTGVEATF